MAQIQMNDLSKLPLPTVVAAQGAIEAGASLVEDRHAPWAQCELADVPAECFDALLGTGWTIHSEQRWVFAPGNVHVTVEGGQVGTFRSIDDAWAYLVSHGWRGEARVETMPIHYSVTIVVE